LITVVGLPCNTRAVSPMPLAFRARSMICCMANGVALDAPLRRKNAAEAVAERVNS
jgi:hypothetical protein